MVSRLESWKVFRLAGSWCVPVILFTAAFALYAHTLTSHYTYDSVCYANQIRNYAATGRPGWLAHPHHLLYNPMGFITWTILKRVGLMFDPLTSLQYMNAFLGAILAVVAYSIFRGGGIRLGRSNPSHLTSVPVALTAAVLLTCAYGYWTCATDGRVNISGLLAAVVALGLSWGILETPTVAQCIIAALAAVTAVALHQSHGLLVISGVGAVFLAPVNWRRRARLAFLYILVFALGVAVAYIGVGYLVRGMRSWNEMRHWALAYSENGQWWNFNILANLVLDARALINVFIPIYSITPGTPHWLQIIRSIHLRGAAIAISIAVLYSAIIVAKGVRCNDFIRRKIIVLWLFALPYAAFFTVWNPGYFVFWLPVAFALVAFAALILSSTRPALRIFSTVMLAIWTVMSGYFNATTAILPNLHKSRNELLLTCDALRKHADSGDLVILTGMGPYSFADTYIPYFAEMPVRSLNTVFGRENGNVPAGVRSIRGVMKRWRTWGHRVIVLSEFDNSSAWLELSKRYPVCLDTRDHIERGYDLRLLFDTGKTKAFTLVPRETSAAPAERGPSPLPPASRRTPTPPRAP